MNFKIIIALIGIILTSCATVSPLPRATLTPTPTQPLAQTMTPSPIITFTHTPFTLPPDREIVFTTTAGKDFTGTAYGDGKTAIILANMSIGGAKQWDPFVALVNPQKFTTITFDYRNINEVDPDMDVILNWLKEEGYEHVICIGASLGTRACNHIALEPEIIGLVLVAGTVHHATVAQATYPKLFIAGALDRWAFDIQNGYKQAAEPKKLVLFENSRVHGTDLFHSQDSQAFLSALLDFLNGLAQP